MLVSLTPYSLFPRMLPGEDAEAAPRPLAVLQRAGAAYVQFNRRLLMLVPLRIRLAWARLGRKLTEILPKGLFARSLIIIIAPVFLLQALVAFVFMEEHYRTVTARLAEAV